MRRRNGRRPAAHAGDGTAGPCSGATRRQRAAASNSRSGTRGGPGPPGSNAAHARTDRARQGGSAVPARRQHDERVRRLVRTGGAIRGPRRGGRGRRRRPRTVGHGHDGPTAQRTERHGPSGRRARSRPGRAGPVRTVGRRRRVDHRRAGGRRLRHAHRHLQPGRSSAAGTGARRRRHRVPRPDRRPAAGREPGTPAPVPGHRDVRGRRHADAVYRRPDRTPRGEHRRRVVPSCRQPPPQPGTRSGGTGRCAAGRGGRGQRASRRHRRRRHPALIEPPACPGCIRISGHTEGIQPSAGSGHAHGRGARRVTPRDPGSGYAGEGFGCHADLGCVGGFLSGVGSGENFQADVTVGFDPLIVLFGEYGADEPYDGLTAGEDTHDVGAAADFPFQALLRVRGPDLPPDLPRVGGEREEIRFRVGEMVGNLREFLGECIDDPVELHADLSRGGVVERREDPNDRRRRIVSIADVGRPAIEAWLGPGAAAWREALQPLAPAERRLVVDTLRAYERAAGKRAPPAS
ncbi:hypothetical protein FMEAI12_4110031 [Parafrankia sp. Ea1.12]|nr:hypothetical protein FMEAI12_4110031 [Parafrankia sp. Ea1.12]